jgi:AcrR family transcriptional regulator
VSSPHDLTARARIRDAAIALFADRGIAASSVRDIAQAAGVSSGLVRHHFGSKEGLRDACDEYTMARATAMGVRLVETATLDRLTPELLLWQRYLFRSVLDGTPTGNALFDQMIEYGEWWLGTTDYKVADPKAYLAVLSAMKMSTFVLHDQLSRVFGQDVHEVGGWARMVRAMIEVFSHQLVTPELLDQARARLDQLIAESQAEETQAHETQAEETQAPATTAMEES